MKKIVKAIAIITIFAVITRALGFVLRVYISRKLGAEMLGIYQVAISVFGVMCTLIASGIPLMISRTVANAHAQKEWKRENRVVSSGFWFSLLSSIVICGFVFFFPKSLNFVFASKTSTEILIWLLPGVIASAVYCTFRGALWGQKKFFWISFSEFFEQIIRIFLIVFLFEKFSNIANGGVIAAISLSIACVASAILVAILYFTNGGKIASPFPEMLPLLKSSSPITTVRTASSLGQSAIAIIIPLRLMMTGITKAEALSLFGIAVGMALPLIMIPSTLVGALATAVVPDISENVTNKKEIATNPNFKAIKSKINTSLNATMIIGFLLVPVYFALGTEIGLFLFNNKSAGIFTSRAAFLMIPMSLSHITSSILNATGFEIRSLIHYAISSIFLFTSVFFLPEFIGIYSLIIGMAALSISSTILNLILLGRKKLLKASHIKNFLFLFAYAIPSAFLAKYSYVLINMLLPSFVALGVAGLLSVACFIGFASVFGQFDMSMFFSKRKSKLKPENQVNSSCK